MTDDIIRLGVLVIHNDPDPEVEFAQMAPSAVTVHTARFETPRGTGEEFLGLDPELLFRRTGLLTAIDQLADLGVHALGYCFTSSSVFDGPRFDDAFESEVADLAGGIPVVTAGRALREAVQRTSAARYLVVSPPWFTDRTVEASISFLGLPPDRAEAIRYELPAGWDSVAREDRFDAGARHLVSGGRLLALIEASGPDSDTVVIIPGGGFRSLHAAQVLWVRHRVRTLSANRALLDAMLICADHSRVSRSTLRPPR